MTVFTVEATIATFDIDSFKGRLATSLSVDVSAITLSVNAGSIIIMATISTSDATAAASICPTLNAFVGSTNTASAALGVAIATTAPCTSSTTYVTAPPPYVTPLPSPLLPPPRPPLPLSSASSASPLMALQLKPPTMPPLNTNSGEALTEEEQSGSMGLLYGGMIIILIMALPAGLIYGLRTLYIMHRRRKEAADIVQGTVAKGMGTVAKGIGVATKGIGINDHGSPGSEAVTSSTSPISASIEIDINEKGDGRRLGRYINEKGLKAKPHAKHSAASSAPYVVGGDIVYGGRLGRYVNAASFPRKVGTTKAGTTVATTPARSVAPSPVLSGATSQLSGATSPLSDAEEYLIFGEDMRLVNEHTKALQDKIAGKLAKIAQRDDVQGTQQQAAAEAWAAEARAAASAAEAAAAAEETMAWSKASRLARGEDVHEDQERVAERVARARERNGQLSTELAPPSLTTSSLPLHLKQPPANDRGRCARTKAAAPVSSMGSDGMGWDGMGAVCGDRMGSTRPIDSPATACCDGVTILTI